MRPDIRYSLIVPVYRNASTIEPLLAALREAAATLDRTLEVVFVVDGSPDDSYPLLRRHLPAAPFSSQLICLSRNFGSFAAIRMGLEAARGEYFSVMAADLQEPPTLIVDFFTALAREPIDITIGVRERRHDPFWSALASKVFWQTYRRLIQREVPSGGVDVFGCNRTVRDALLTMRESHSTLVGLLFWLGFRRKEISYARLPRPSGRSGWTFRRKFKYLLDSSFAFTDLPITILMMLGALGCAGSVTVGVIVFLAWLGGAIPVPGYTPLVILVLGSFSFLILSLGIVGSYVWRTFENTKQRPLYVPMTKEAFDGGGAS